MRCCLTELTLCMYRDPVWRISRKPLWLALFGKRKKKASLDGVWMICCNWAETVSLNFCGKWRQLKAEAEHHMQYQSHHTQVFWKQSEVQYLSFELNYSGGKDELEADFDWTHWPAHSTCHVPWWWSLFFPFPLEFPEETPIQVRMTLKWRLCTQGSLTWEDRTKAQPSEVQGSVVTKTKTEERYFFL